MLSHAVRTDMFGGAQDTKRELARRPPPMEVPPGLLAAMEAEYNASQMAALRSGLDGDDVMLIQGPPGAVRPDHAMSFVRSACVVARRCCTLPDTDHTSRCKGSGTGAVLWSCSAYTIAHCPAVVSSSCQDVCTLHSRAGTGKTKTILGLLSVIMHSRPASRSASSSGVAASSSGGEAPTSDMARLRLWHASSPWVIGVQNPRCALSNCRRWSGLRHYRSALTWCQ